VYLIYAAVCAFIKSNLEEQTEKKLANELNSTFSKEY
jgi:hypothetical protein